MKPVDNKQKKSATRFYAVQALFQMEASDIDADAVRDQFFDHRFGVEEDGLEWLEGNTLTSSAPMISLHYLSGLQIGICSFQSVPSYSSSLTSSLLPI